MDGVSAAAAIVALFQIGISATKLARSLSHTASKLKTAGEDVGQFALNIGLFASIIKISHDSLHPHFSGEISSPVLQYCRDERVFDQVVESSRGVKRKIKDMRSKIKKLEHRSRLECWIIWLMLRPKVSDLGLEMESVRSNLLLVHAIVQLAVVQLQVPSRETEEKIKDLQREIRIHLSTIENLQEQLRQINSRWGSEPDQDNDDRIFSVQQALVDLGESMASTGNVPQPVTSTSSSTVPTQDSESHGLSSHRRRRHHTRHVIVDDSSPATSYSQQPIPLPSTVTNQNGTARRHHIPERPSQASTSNFPPSSASSNVDSVHPLQEIAGGRSLPSSSSHEDQDPTVEIVRNGDYIDVTPTSNQFILDPSSNLRTLNGWINHRETTVVIDPKLKMNVISRNFATRLKLQIELADNFDRDIVGESENAGPHLATGQVAVTWMEPSHRIPFQVICFIADDIERDVMFGQPFLRKYRHYRSSTEVGPES